MQHLVVGVALATLCIALPAQAQEEEPSSSSSSASPSTDETTATSESAEEEPSSSSSSASPSGEGTTTTSDSADTSAASTTAVNKNLADQANGNLTKNVLLLREQSTRAKNWGLLVTMSTFAGSGEFVLGAQQAYSQYIAQIFDFRPTYGFNVKTHRLRLQGRFAFEQDYTPPPGGTNPARQWRPYDSSVAIADDTMYHWDATGILFNSAFRVTLPTSYESINVRQQYLALGLTLGARRLVGPVQLSFISSATKYINGSHVAVISRDTRATDGSEFARGPRDTPQDLDAGYANNNWLFANNVSATFLASDNFAVSASFGVLAFVKYSITGTRDQYTSINADPGAGTAQRFSSDIEVNYDFSHITKDILDLPFRLTAALGAQATTPIQQANNHGWIPPLIINAFTSRAASNYGSIYLDLTAIF